MVASYTVTLWCGCKVYVSRHPLSGLTHSRIIERRGTQCRARQHDVGTRLWLWELLPDRRNTSPSLRFELPG